MAKGAFVISLLDLYYYRPSMCFTKEGKRILDMIVPDAEETIENIDWLDGVIMGYILNFNWDRLDPDYPNYLELLDGIYGNDRESFTEVLSCLSEQDYADIDVYIGMIIDAKNGISKTYDKVFRPYTITDRVTKVKFSGDKSNMSEVIYYER